MNYRKSVLENGLRVVTLSLPAARSVTLGLLVEAGSSVESPEQQGIAHLVEHMLFQGSSNRDALEIARLMDGAGGRIGGFTSRDYTCYFAQVLEEFTPYAIDLLGDVILNPVFPEEALEREKRAILCEAETARDNPEQRAHEMLRAHLWPDHPLGRPILGDLDHLDSLSREDLIYFLHNHYLPDRMVVAAAGALIHEDFVAQVRDAFWRLLGERSLTPARRPLTRPGLTLEPAPVSQAYFSLGVEACAYASNDRYAMHLFDQVLGAGISSRLFGTLRERHGLVYHVGSAYEAWREAGLLTIEGSTIAANLPHAVELVFEELDAICDGSRPVTSEELHRAKIRLRSQIQLAGEDTHALMSRLATQELYFGRYLPEEELLETIESVDPEGLRRWVHETVAPAYSEAALAVVGPIEDQADALRSALANTVGGVSEPRCGSSLTRAANSDEEPSDGTQTADQEELDGDPETPRRAGQRDRRQDQSQGREDAQGLARRGDRSVRQAVTPASVGSGQEAIS